MPRRFHAVAVAGAACSCRRCARRLPRYAARASCFEISGKLFVFNYRLGIATYVVTLNPLQPMGEGQVAVVSFQNPAGGDPIVVARRSGRNSAHHADQPAADLRGQGQALRGGDPHRGRQTGTVLQSSTRR